MAGYCSVTFRHPKTIVDRALKTALGQESSQQISQHTQQGLDATGRPMKPLTPTYAAEHQGGDRTRRLTRTGRMLLSARLKYAHKAVMIVWSDPKAVWHQRSVNWIGLSEVEKDRVTDNVKRRWSPNWNANLKTKTRKR
jgi:hypothetical protein